MFSLVISWIRRGNDVECCRLRVGIKTDLQPSNTWVCALPDREEGSNIHTMDGRWIVVRIHTTLLLDYDAPKCGPPLTRNQTKRPSSHHFMMRNACISQTTKVYHVIGRYIARATTCPSPRSQHFVRAAHDTNSKPARLGFAARISITSGNDQRRFSRG